MLDALLAAVVVALLVAAGLAALYAVTVVPFLLAVGLAERRGQAPGRWAGLAVLAVLLALALAALLVRAGAPRTLAFLPLALAFVPAGALRTGAADRLGAAAGRHARRL